MAWFVVDDRGFLGRGDDDDGGVIEQVLVRLQRSFGVGAEEEGVRCCFLGGGIIDGDCGEWKSRRRGESDSSDSQAGW